MKFAATLLATAATVLSLGATPQSLSTVTPVASVASVRSAHTGEQSFLTLSDSNASEAPNAWLMALGFLGVVVLRRTRSGPMS